MRKLYWVFKIFVSIFFINVAFSGVDTAKVSGRWDSTSTWSDGTIPTENDNVVILHKQGTTDIQITIPEGYIAKCRDIQLNGTTGKRIFFDPGSSNLSSALEIYGTLNCDTVGMGSTIIDNSSARNSKIIFKRQTSGSIFGNKWFGPTTANLRAEIDVPSNVVAVCDTHFKALRLTVKKGTLDMTNHDLRLDSSFNKPGHLLIDSGASVINIRGIFRTGGSPADRCSTLTIAGTLEIDSTIAMYVIRMKSTGVLRTKATNLLGASLSTFDISSASAKGSVIDYAKNGNQNIYAGTVGATYSGLSISGSGVKSIGLPVTVNDSLIFSGSATVAGAITRGSNMWLVYSGTTPKTTSTELLTTTAKLKINNTQMVTLDKSLSSVSNLWLQLGTLNTSLNSLTLNSSGTLIRTHGKIMGNFTIPTSTTIFYNNIDSIGTSSELPSSINILKVSTPSSLTLTNNLTVTGVCSLLTGRLKPQNFSLTIASSANAVSTGGYVDGNLKVDVGTTGIKNFPIGTLTSFLPVTIDFTSLNGTGTVTAKTIKADYPSVQFPDSTVKSYWNFIQSGITNFSANMGFTYNENELFFGVDENLLILGKWDGSSWNFPNVQNRDPITNKITVSNVNSFSDFIIGKNYQTFLGAPNAKINGVVFNDYDADGFFDVGENGLQNWKIIANGLYATDTSFTNANGEYQLNNLYAGSYNVFQEVMPSWTQSYPVGNHNVMLQMNTDTMGIDFGNYKPGSASGNTFDDYNGNGIKDLNELSISNWKINISGTTHTGATFIDSAFTDANGDYIFSNIPIGNYNLTQQFQSGWFQTFPQGIGIYSINMRSDENIVDRDFGNFKLVAVSGNVFEDINGNGIHDIEDIGIQNWKLKIDGMTALNTIVKDSIFTDANGNYVFNNVKGGTYTISENVQNDWVQTFPNPQTYSITTSSGINIGGNDFGNFKKGIISGTKFNDINGNGIRDIEDIGLENFQLQLFTNNNLYDSTFTDVNGNFIFTSLSLGTYVLTEVLPNGWIRTTSDSIYTVQILSNTISTQKNFGNFQLGKISGISFTDINGNGVKEIGETPLSNQIIRLDGTIISTTDVNGEYSFQNLTFGTYTISSQVQNGWIQTLPTSNYSIDIRSGDMSIDNDFGNFKLGKIFGIVFEDINGNQIKDINEIILENWKIKLSGARIDSAFTNLSGIFSFDGLSGGSYFISEETQSGWFQTVPQINYSLVMLSGLDTSNFKFGNYRLGTISGLVFNDVNNNSTRDIGESGISNWKLKIDNGISVDSTYTNQNGNYTFLNLKIGNYILYQDLKNGWIKTFPVANNYQIPIVAGSVVTGNNFGNFELGIFLGKVFNDINANGTKEINEPGISNWTVTLSGTINASTVTNDSGYFSFVDLPFGSYTIDQVEQTGWIQSFPFGGNNYLFNVTSGTKQNAVDFGNYQLGSIAGNVFEDINGNGIKEVGESNLQNWKIYISGLRSDSLLSDANGNYKFNNLQIGEYEISEQLQTNWVQSFPQSPKYILSITSGLHIQSRNFGNYRYASINGIVFEDINGNNIKDTLEVLLSNWKIKLSGPKIDSTFSDINGNFSFQNLFVGNYTLTQTMQNNWFQTYPLTNEHGLNLISGENETNINFGNFKHGIISGKIFDDLDNDGTQDGNEYGLSNWKIKLSGPKTDSILTDASGNYYFDSLIAGSYTIEKESQLNWIQSFPTNNSNHFATIISQANIAQKNFGSHLLSKISGTSYNDINGNGAKDVGESGISNIEIRLSGSKNDTVFTDANGNYTFYYLYAGSYVVNQVVTSGWSLTEPQSGSINVFVVRDGITVSNKNFGNFQLGKISGVIFNDLNSNGIKDVEDILLSGWRVRLSGIRNDSLFTDSIGQYTFSNLLAGNYLVSEVVQNGWVQSAPLSQNFSLNIISGSNFTNKDFGNYQLGKVSGIVFDDINSNGIRDNGDNGIANWKLYIYNANKLDSVVTDENGNYIFENVSPGNLIITQSLKENWLKTFPNDSSYQLTISSGQILSNKNFGNFQLGKILGTIFNDVNGNTNQDEGEFGIANWKIFIFGNKTDSILTDGDGKFEFNSLLKGNYFIKSQQILGWIQSYPIDRDTYSVAIFSGTNSTNKNFGNYQLGKISGTVFNDFNSNGIKEAGESGLQNWKVRLLGNGFDSAFTDVNGSYSFKNLDIGSYIIKEEIQIGWSQTSPTPNFEYQIQIFSGTNSTNKNFGNFIRGAISGTVFDDVNGNGLKDVGENNLALWKIKLSGAKIDSTISDESGSYEFENLETGTYYVSEVLQTGWHKTVPQSGIYTVNIVSGTYAINKNFGNYKTSSISGNVFNDINGNGMRDNGENAISNLEIYLSGNLFDTVSTNINGDYTFSQLTIGTYILKQKIQNGWIQSFPQTDYYTIPVQSGAIITSKNFGSYKLGKISGTTFNDVNGNGIKDNGENNLQNWKIKIWSQSFSDSTFSNDSGFYEFKNLKVGNYNVQQIFSNEFFQTFPFTQNYNLQILGSSNFTQKNFGVFQYGKVSGFVFNDKNANGIQDINENSMINWKLKLYSETYSDTIFTDSNGVFEFKNLEYGNYNLSQIFEPSWRQTFPQNNQTYDILISSGTNSTNKNFGNYQLGIIRGNVFNDLNGDSIKNSNEIGIQNCKIKIFNQTFSETTYTDANGNFELINIPQGNYTLSEIIPNNWSQTFPNSSIYNLQFTTGSQIFTNKNFGNFEYSKILGNVFEDMNANGIKEVGENNLQNWKIKISGKKIDSTFSNVNGNFEFQTLSPGTYIVSEVIQNTWFQSLPQSGNYILTLTSGANSQNNSFGNYRFGKISGNVFYDINGNGIKEINEDGLQNWKVKISGIKNDSVFTSQNGDYTFTNLKPSEYILTEELQNNWLQTFPENGNHNIIVTSNSNNTNINFGNSKISSITGKIFDDFNNNGIYDNGESGISNWKIKISGRKVDSTITNQNGEFNFSTLSPGNYIIAEEVQNYWVQTYPTFPGTYNINLIDGSDTSGILFGNFKFAKISGTKFNDIDGDGIRDNGETGIPNWKMKISGAKTDSTFTDANGNYNFENLYLGTYIISEFPNDEWIQTLPQNRYTIQISTSGQVSSGNNFGNFKFAKISGDVFSDINGNGIYDNGENGIPNWKIFVQSNSHYDSTITDANGFYEFNKIKWGMYSIKAQNKNNFIQTYPESLGIYIIPNVTSGFIGTDFYFAEKPITSFVEETTTPTKFELFQNYPNPFNPNTTIKFSVDENTNVKLKVYNIVGEEVAVLFDNFAEKNKLYYLEFDAENLNSGIYFYRLENNHKIQSQKMLLLK